ncbi:SDR family oxidoreductase [Nevskia sp.]|uniref:SDR family NAD(P)-dependent oxidoreductase n=1 Tax=Nevskia sp. TaxID=1929292 RepID=UPI0025D226CC|nr:SDR family oxidoreductase [Nevskia sp.]
MSDIDELFSMKGRVALVTGAASGMGDRFARTLAKAGAKVICVSRRTERIEKLAAEIRRDGGQAAAVQIDIADRRSVIEGFEAATKAFGLIDVLINNAGQLSFETIPTIDEESWQNLINVNMTGTLRMTQAFSRRLIEAKTPGVIVNISSITGMGVMRGLTPYGCVKAALNHLTKQTAADLLDHGIRCNAIAPGYFHTEMSADVFATNAGKAIQAGLPPKRAGKVEELDGALLLLASGASSYINGAVLPVDAAHVVLLT